MIRLYREFVESIRIALDQLKAHRTRSFLTALGVIIGVMAVTLMGTAINGLDKGFEQSMNMIGTDVFFVEKRPWQVMGNEWWRYRNRPDINLQKVNDLNEMFAADEDSLLSVAVPVSSTWRTVRRQDRSIDGVMILGTSPEYVITNTADFAHGRFFSPVEASMGANVVVIGHEVAEALFPEGNAVGQEVSIHGQRFEVVGVVARQGDFLGMMSWDKNVTMPLKALRKFFRGNWGNSIRVKVREGASMNEAMNELEGYTRRIRGLLPGQENDFELNRSAMLEEQLGPTKRAIAFAGLFITSLALFVGAIGIMNITFVSVRERTREIGTRRALGARRRSILMQFLVEATSICLIGGVVGLLITWGIQHLLHTAFPNFPLSFSIDLVAIAFFVSVAVGVLSGFAPALAASRLDPATALRHE